MKNVMAEVHQAGVGIRGKVQVFLDYLCILNKTICGLNDGFYKMSKEANNDSVKDSIDSIKKRFNKLFKEDQKTARTVKVYPKQIDTLDNFVKHIKGREDGNGFKFYPK